MVEEADAKWIWARLCHLDEDATGGEVAAVQAEVIPPCDQPRRGRELD